MAAMDAPTVNILPGSGLPAGTSRMSSVLMCKPLAQRRPVECLPHICSDCTTKARVAQSDALKRAKTERSSHRSSGGGFRAERQASMSTLPERANVVVIGAGIVGNSMAYHLARLGWQDIVLLDKGPLPNPGGSTGHASNFIFLVDHSKEMTRFTLDSVAQYKELGTFIQSG